MESRSIPAEWLPHYTYADYKTWEGDWELIYGIPYAMSPSAKRIQQLTGRKLMRLLEDALLQNNACHCEVYYELDWIITEHTVVRPDIMIVCGKFDDDFLHVPPSLIIEVISKRTQITDRNMKFTLYESNKVPYYLIVDPERKTTEIFQLVNKEYKAVQTHTFALSEVCRIEAELDKLWV